MTFTVAAVAREAAGAIEKVLSTMERHAADDPAMIPAADEIGAVTASHLAHLAEVAAQDVDDEIRAVAASKGR